MANQSVVSSAQDRSLVTEEGPPQCQICHDLATGFHYGVWSCEGCKAFFKRSLQGPIYYMCPATNNCTIDKQRRKSCQACRLRKCLEVGMMKRRERRRKQKQDKSNKSEKPKKARVTGNDMDSDATAKSPGSDNTPETSLSESPLPNTRGLDVSQFASPGPNTVGREPQSASPVQPSSGCEDSPESSHTTTLLKTSLLPTPTAKATKPMSRTPSQNDLGEMSHRIYAATAEGSQFVPDKPHPLVLKLLQIDLPDKTLGMGNVEITEYGIMHRLITLADSELVDVVNWAKLLPGFSRLAISDRITLIETSWMELLTFGASWRSRANTAFLINFATDLQVDEKMADVAKMLPILMDMWNVALQLNRLKVTQEEFLLLRAIILLNSEVARFSKMEVVNEVKSYYLEALDYESCRTLQLPIGQGNYRLCQLLCLLPFTRQAAFKCVTNLFYLHTREAVPVGKLISELLSAQKEFLSSK